MSEERRPYSPGAKSPGEGWFLENKETHKPVTRAQKARANSDGVFKQDGMNVDASVALQWVKGRVVGDTKKAKKTREEKEAKIKAAEEKARKKQLGRKAATRTAARRASLAARVEKFGQNYTRKIQDARRRSVPFNTSLRGSLGSTFKKPRKMTKKEALDVLKAKESENQAANLRRKANALEARVSAIRAAAAAEKARIAEAAAKIIMNGVRENEYENENNSANMGAQAAAEAERARIEEEKLKEAAKIMQKAKGKNEYRVYDDSDDEEENNSPKMEKVLSAILEENNSNLTASEKNALNALAHRMRRV